MKGGNDIDKDNTTIVNGAGQADLIKNSKNNFSFRNLTIDNIKDISNLPLTQIKIIIHDLESNSFKFIKKVVSIPQNKAYNNKRSYYYDPPDYLCVLV